MGGCGNAEPMTDQQTIDYGEIMHDAVLFIIRRALKEAETNGLGAENHFYIGFTPNYDGVMMSDYLREQNPEEMTIILQHRFWNLQVEQDQFSVDLSFNQKIERLTIPFEALTSFADPSVPIGFKLSESLSELTGAEPQPQEKAEIKPFKPAPKDNTKSKQRKSPSKADKPTASKTDNVIHLDQFRPKK